MDKISKVLNKLKDKEKEQIKIILNKIKAFDTQNLDIKKLKGREDIFRVKKGKIRVIYRIDANKNIFILTIEHRNDNTYKI